MQPLTAQPAEFCVFQTVGFFCGEDGAAVALLPKPFSGYYFRDPDSNDMLTIILQSRTFDLGSIHMFNWGGVASVFTDLLAKGSNAYASTYAKRIKSGKKAIEKDLKKLLK